MLGEEGWLGLAAAPVVPTLLPSCRETDTPPEGAAFNRPGHGQPCSG